MLLDKPRKLSQRARKAAFAAGVLAIVAAAMLFRADPTFGFYVLVLGMLGLMWLIHGIFGKYY
jgi:uncharacterized membrane protein HdeD (DUF308 family)